MSHLPAGCATPDLAELDAFWRRASGAVAEIRPDEEYQVRWIGLDDTTTQQVLDLVSTGDKTGTYTLPWLVEASGQPTPAIGDAIILIDFGGHPRLLVRLTAIEEVSFGDITELHTGVDGTPVRDLTVWKPLHTRYWNDMLEPYGRSVSEEMPVWVEKFELLFDSDPI